MSPLGALPHLSRSARRALVTGALLSALTAVALIAQAWALGHGLAAVVTEGARPEELGGEFVVLTGAILARAVLGWATEAVSARAAAGAKEELRALLLDSALHRGPEWIRRYGPAELSAVATKGLDSLDAYFTKYLPALVTAAVVPPAAGLWILLSDWISALIVLITVPLIPLFAWLVGVYTQRRTARAADSVQRLSGRLLELVRALPVLSAFGRARAQGEVVRRVSEQHRRSTNATLRIAFLSALVLELFSSLSVAVVAVSIGVRLVSGNLDLATGLLVLVLAPECYLPLRSAGAAHHASEDGVEAVRRVDEVVLRDPARSDGGVEPPESGELRVRDLRVLRRSGPAPDGLSFTARCGHVLRLDGFDGIGPSGSGKSTAMAVLLGFAEPDSGRITWGEHDVRAFDPNAWRSRVAWIPQHPTFTGGTVADELDIAGTDQPDLAEHVPAVLAEAAAEHLLHRRVDGLSTGERQRVAVARALLRLRGRARLLLADEPTAHLDSATAHRVNAALERAAADGAAVVLASHRPGGTEAEQAEEREPGVGSIPELPTVRGRIRDLITRRAVLGYALGALSLLSGLALTAASAYLIARASQQPPILTLTVVTVGVRAFALSRAVLRYAERLVTHDDAFRLSGRLRAGLWDALVRIGPARSAGLRRGEGVRRLVDDADAVRDLVPRVLFPPVVAAVVLIGAVVVQTLVLPAAGVVLAVALLLACVAGPAAALLAERRASAAVTEGRRRIAGQVLALLDGAAELLAFGAARTRRAELAEQDRELVHRSRRAAFAEGAATAVNTALVGVAIVAGVWFGASAVANGSLAPELAPLLGLVPLAAAEAVALLPPAVQQWSSLRAAHDRLAPLLAAPDEQQAPLVESDRVELRDAQVRWPGAELPALRGAELALPPGAHVAVLGPSGSGKSTLLAALLGALPVEDGRIARPSPVAWCPQEPQLVSTTVRENLRLANPHAEDAELVEALRSAGLAGWQDRLDTHVGSAGAALSGGEAQRLALARALLVSEARLVLLDEPTAHLDEPTSAELLDRLAHRLRGRTVVHVTHRWSETRYADVVLRVVDGRLEVVREPAHAGSASGVC